MFNAIARHYDYSTSWDVKTLYLYCFIVILSGLFGWLAQHNRSFVLSDHNHRLSGTTGIKRFYFYGAFIVLLLFSGLRIVGTDYPAYQEIFDWSTSVYAEDYGIEPLFLLFNKLLKFAGLDFGTTIFIFSFLTIFLVFVSIRQYSSNLSITLALLAYTSLYYFQSFNLIRMYMAASLTLYAYKHIISGKTRKFLFLFIVACFIHSSVLLFFFPTMGVVIYRKSNKWFWIMYVTCFILSFILLSQLPKFQLIERYVKYVVSGASDNGIGMMHLLINLPLILFYLYARKKLPNSPFLPSLLVLTLCEFLIGCLSYKVMMLGRSLVYYNVLFIIVIPCVIRQLSVLHAKWSRFISCLYVLYLFGRLYMYFTEYLYRDGIMPYETIFTLSE